jgi:hypothetical protein
LRAKFSGQAGVGATFSVWYSGNIGPLSLPTNVGQIAPDSAITTATPAQFTSEASGKSAATFLNNGTPAAMYAAYVINPNATTVYVGISTFNSCTAIASSAGCQSTIVQIPANSSAVVPVPAIGLAPSSAGNWYGYCSTAVASLVDPASACLFKINFKTLVGVAPN